MCEAHANVARAHPHSKAKVILQSLRLAGGRAWLGKGLRVDEALPRQRSLLGTLAAAEPRRAQLDLPSFVFIWAVPQFYFMT